jgi:excisionase family DNA binding protein
MNNSNNSYTVGPAIFDKRIWKVSDVASFLGCSVKTVYKKAALGEIPSIKKGKFRYFVPLDVENWLLEGDSK